jgi:asparagine synthase (glutamine-hydrolysing)
MVTDRYHTDHHTLTIDNAAFSDSLPQMIWYHDEPLNHANSVPIHHISRVAREHVTVVLTGEGSDELFGGYPRYNIVKLAELSRHFPGGLREVFGATALVAAGVLRSRRLGKIGRSLPRSLAELAIYNSAFLESSVVDSLAASDVPQVDLSFRQQFLPEAELSRGGVLSHLWRLELRTYLVSLLHRMDKMTMAASIEARVPFLDHRLVEWALRLPDSVKLERFKNKRLVREVALDYLPPEVVHRRKSGFGVPIGRWARDPELLGRYLDLFFDDAYASRDYMNVDGVRQLIRAHLAGHQDHGETIWNLMNLELWHRIFLDGQSPTSFTA